MYAVVSFIGSSCIIERPVACAQSTILRRSAKSPIPWLVLLLSENTGIETPLKRGFPWLKSAPQNSFITVLCLSVLGKVRLLLYLYSHINHVIIQVNVLDFYVNQASLSDPRREQKIGHYPTLIFCE